MNKLFMQNMFLFALFLLCLTLCSCGQTEKQKPKKTSVSASGTIAVKKEYDRQMTGVIKSIKVADQTLVVSETTTAAQTVFTYTDITEAYNTYGDIKTVEQFAIGDIVDIYFLEKEHKIIKLQNSDSAWIYKDVRKFSIQREEESFRIADRKYQYDPASLVVSRDGEAIDMLTMDEQDTLTVQGIGSRVYSITVTKGHGYVRFHNYDQFIGGMVEIGYGIIKDVTEDMLLIVPEGSYRMLMEHGMLRAEKDIMVEQGKELVIDLGAYQTEIEKTGRVCFMIEPEGAQLNINGVPQVYIEPLELSYGKNVIQVFHDGYTAYAGKLNVKRPYQVVKINLAKDHADAQIIDTEEEVSEEEEDIAENEQNETTENIEDTATENTTTENEESENRSDEDEDATENTSEDREVSEDTTIEGVVTEMTETDPAHTITINAPSDVKVYVNGDYIGKSPVSFEKLIGTFTVALSKNGYQTASYTLTMEDDKESSYLSFPDLVKLSEE